MTLTRISLFISPLTFPSPSPTYRHFHFLLEAYNLGFFFIFSRSGIGFSSSFRRIETFVLLADLQLGRFSYLGSIWCSSGRLRPRLVQAASKNDNDPQSKLTSCTKKNGETNKKQLTWPYLWSVTLLQQVEVKLVDCWSWLRETFRLQPTKNFFFSFERSHPCKPNRTSTTW